MDSGDESSPRTTATAVAAPDVRVPTPRTAPPVESAAPGTAPAGIDTTTTPPVQAPATNPCRCGHDRDAHEHFRRGTDCAGCGCARFRKPSLLARLRG